MKSHEFLGIPVFSLDELKSMKEQAVPVSEPENENETAIYRSALSKEKLIYSMDHSQSIQELFSRAVKAFPNKRCFGTRYPSLVDGEKVWGEYVWKSYEEADEDRQHFGFGLMQLYDQHVTNKVDKWFMGIMSVNRYEWIIADLGAGSFSIGNAALYDTLGPDACEYILNHAEIPIAVVSIDKVPTIFKLVPKCPHLKVIIVLESLLKGEKPDAESYKEQGSALGVTIVSFNETLQLGKSNPRPFQLPSSDDIATLSYTSGTTGTPKAAMLTHGNFISVNIGGQIFRVEEDSVHLSYLPLAHIIERATVVNFYMKGAAIGFYRGSIPLLVEDINSLKPTLLCAVPRVLNKIYDKMMLATVHSDSYITSNLVSQALKSKLYYLKNEGTVKHSIWDPLVFNKMKQALGGNIVGMVYGGAPIDPQVVNFFRVVLRAHTFESYGQTETCGGATVVWPEDYDPGHVGPPVISNEMKLVSVPEMGYYAKDLKGEVWFRGGGIFKGYYKDEEKTKEAITEDGWLKTGDIGSIDSVGRLTIIDRKKNIFKLSQGEYIAPEKLEIAITKSNYVSQIYVHGNSLQNVLVAIVVPDEEHCIHLAVKKGWLPSDTIIPTPVQPGQAPNELFIQLCKNSDFKIFMLEQITAAGKEAKFRGFEFVKAIHLEPELFSLESDLLTPTMKMKRHNFAKKYSGMIDSLYGSLAK
ncbi:hypothetical protein BC833DRAFT_635697 [Globomyces pollinis-pini]|nr:hypothetical protein BC833DRAFT_635697 [Globomyces pollinis-pini]